jgi:acyl carrier protein
VKFHRLLHLDAEVPRDVQLLAARAGAGFTFSLASRDGVEGGWTVHATGSAAPAEPGEPEPMEPGALAARCPRAVSAGDHYARMNGFGLAYGPAFQVVESVARGEGELLARLRLPADLRAESGAYALHPALLDGALQSLAWLGEGDAARLPAGVGEIRWHGAPASELWCHATVTGTQRGGTLSAELRLADLAGRPIATLGGVELRPVGAAAAGEGVERSLYSVAWDEVELAGGPADAAPEGWIVLADGGGVAEGVARRLRGAGHPVILARPGDALAAAEGSSPWTVRPGSAEDFAALLDAAPACRRILHLWSLDAPGLAGDAGALGRAWELGCTSTLALVRALAARPGTRPRLWVATRGAQAAAEGDAVAVAQAPVWGLARAIGQAEHPELWGGLVDLDPRAGDEAEAERLVAAVRGAGAEDLRAMRGHTLLAPRLRRTPPAAGTAPAPLRADATYLVTGGFGGLAGVAADWLVERGARRLLLVGRTPLPPRERWAGLGADDPMRGRVESVRRLEARGVSVHHAAADVGDPAGLAALLAGFEAAGWPPVRGVVHLAGVVDDRLAAAPGGRDDAVWRPKALGAWLLHQWFEDRPLDLFVLFSSLAPLVSRPGQSVYAGANAFLDALAHERRRQGRPALSIGWGPWAEVGMVARLGMEADLAAAGIEPLYPDQGLELLHLLARHDTAHAAAVNADWAAALPRMHPGGAPPLVAGLGAAAAPRRAVADGADTADLWSQVGEEADPALRRRALCGLLVGRAAAVLNIDPALLAPERPLAELGMDSIVAVELSGWVGQRFEVTIPIAEWLRGPSLEEIAGRIEGERVAVPALAGGVS